jgi:putative glutamine amidotransferase
MSKPPIIGITVGEIINKEDPWAPLTYGQAHTYTEAIEHAGGAPILLPLVGEDVYLKAQYDLCDGVLFAGGNDISPEHYGEAATPFTISISNARDEQELKLARWVIADDKPALCICRGLQLLNVAQGGTLYQDIVDAMPEAHDHESSTKQKNITYIAHQLGVEPNSLFAKILGETTVPTNAHHHQAVKKLGDKLVASAWAEDGIIEAIEMPDKKFVMGVQSHPESLEAAAVPVWQKFFRAFVDAAAN